MQGTNADEAMREIRLDVEEGADIVLVKPALPCLDLIRRAKQEFGSPLAAYQVSGEYAMIKAAAARGMLDEARAMWETLYAIRRGGAGHHPPPFSPTAPGARTPPNPKELVSTTSGAAARPSPRRQSRSQAGSGRSRLMVGGSQRRSMASAQIAASIAPLAPSAWP